MEILTIKMKVIAQNLKRELNADLYYVGGYVRDMLINVESKDIDCELFNTTPDEFVSFLNNHNIKFEVDFQAKFPVYRFKLDGEDIEVGFPRRDNKTGSKHNDFEIEIDPFMSVKEAARRRDFTFNAIYMNVLTEEIIDPFGGVADMDNRVLRAVDEKTFKEDPLRLFRAFQFVARFDLDYTEFVKMVDQDFLNETKHTSKDSMFKEVEKAVHKGKNFMKALDFLKDSGLLEMYFAPVFKTVGSHQSKVHHAEGDVWEHTKRVVQAAMNAMM